MSSAIADDANWMAVGGAGNFAKNPYVSMEREEVRIAIDDSHVRVRAKFYFKNFGPGTLVTMAFPDETTTNNSESGKSKSIITKFLTWVDGKKVNVSRKRLKTSNDLQVSAAWLKTVPFKRGQSRLVTVDYLADHGFAGNGWVMNSYVLQTGATWRGRIKRCDLFVDWRKTSQLSRPWLELSSMGKRAPKVVWTQTGHRQARTTLRNIEPHYDLDLTMIEGFWNFRMNGRRMAQNLGATTTDSGFALIGKTSDVRIAVANLGSFFGAHIEGTNVDYGSDEALLFGGNIQLADPKHLLLGGRRKVRLRRAVKTVANEYDASTEFVYLRDVIKALGGSITFNSREERYDIRLPK